MHARPPRRAARGRAGDEKGARRSPLRSRQVRGPGRMTTSARLLDTKGWILALEGNEEPYARALAAARPAIVPGLVLAEVDYWFQARRKVMHDLLRDIATGAYQYEPPTALDLERAREIDAKFSR